jgi:hypothetical protein
MKAQNFSGQWFKFRTNNLIAGYQYLIAIETFNEYTGNIDCHSILITANHNGKIYPKFDELQSPVAIAEAPATFAGQFKR